MNMNKQISQCCVVCPNEPNAIAKMTQMLAKEGINIESMLMECFGSLCCARFMCDKDNGLSKKLESAGFQMVEDQVFCLELPNRPGELNKLTKMLCDEKIVIRYLYGTSHGPVTKVMLCVDQPEQAAKIVRDCGANLAGVTP
jgi:hypothetical protein